MSRPLLKQAREHEREMQSNLRMYRDQLSRYKAAGISQAGWEAVRRNLAEAAHHAAIATALRAMDAEQGVEP